MIKALQQIKKYSVHIVLILYFVAIVAQFTQFKTHVMQLSSINLLICFALLVIQYEFSNKLVLNIIALSLLGWLIECVGVNTGLLFGNYTYGNGLGIKIASTSLVMGLVWCGLILALNDITSNLADSKWQQAFLTAALMVFLDLFIEQIASSLDFWHWKDEIIPIQNFIMWALASFVFSFIDLYFFKNKRQSTSFAYVYVGIQFLFFIFLNLLNLLAK